jgi:uncharacterized protein
MKGGREMKAVRFGLLSLLVVLNCFAISIPQDAFCSDKVSSPLQYSGYSFPEYTNYTRSSEYVSMSDGTALAVEIYLPGDGPSGGRFPVIFAYHPYHSAHIDPVTGAIITYFAEDSVAMLTSYGYAMVIGGMRGSGASYGSRVDMSPQLAQDGKELVEWIETQPWCDGNVGMMGGSYEAWAQFATAGQKPAGLKCINPQMMYLDAFTSPLFYPGGIFNKALSDQLGMVFGMRDQNVYIPAAGVFPAAPVIDEDGDGDLADEIPLDLNHNGTFLDDYALPDKPPQYSDGKTREHIYYKATLEHLKNPYFKWVPNAPYRDSNATGSNYTYEDLGPSNFVSGIGESGIPVYNMGGWFDAFPISTAQWYSTLQASNPSKMLISPINHSNPGFNPRVPGPYLAYFGIDLKSFYNGNQFERLRFFDRYLKGVDNGIDTEPPIYLLVMNGGGWRFENEWPIGRQVMTDYYFSAENTLADRRSSNGSDAYHVDFSHDSRQDTSKANRWNLGAMDRAMTRTDKDQKCLTYTSHPLNQDIEVTGHPIVHFWVSSTANDGDFFVYLEDVDENGEAYYVTDGLLRANFAKLVPNEDILPQGSEIEVLPDLPWHGFLQSDYVDGIFTHSKKLELVIDLLPTSWVFKKGHRIRVSIAGADWPTFQLHPDLSPTNNPTDPNNIVPTITVYHDAKHPSRIKLPIIPPKPISFEGTAKIHNRHGGYKGAAELYTFRNDVYLHSADHWFKWSVVHRSEGKHAESLKCRGDLGNLSVVVQRDKDGSYMVHANGNEISFKGTAQ